MDQNLILNMNEHRIKVCVYETEKVDEFIKNKAKGTKVVGAHSLQEMVAQLKKPKRVMIHVKAWPAVDSFIEKLVGAAPRDGGHHHQRGQLRVPGHGQEGQGS